MSHPKWLREVRIPPETTDGQVFIRVGADEIELTIHEWDRFVSDIRDGHYDGVRRHDTPPAPAPAEAAEPDTIIYTDDQAGVDAIETLKARAVATAEALALLDERVRMYDEDDRGIPTSHADEADWTRRARALVDEQGRMGR